MTDTDHNSLLPDAIKSTDEKLQTQIGELQSRVKELEFQNSELTFTVQQLKTIVDQLNERFNRPLGQL